MHARVCSISNKRGLLKNIVIFCFKLIPPFIYSRKTLIKRVDELAKSKSYEQSMYLGNLMGAWHEKEIMQREWFGRPKLVQFEDMQIYIPENHDEYLKHLYGNYMQLPPIEKQKSHHDYIYINLNESYLEK